MTEQNGSRSILMLVFAGVALVTFLLRFAESFWASASMLAVGLAIMGARYYFLAGQEKKKTKVDKLDFTKLKSLRMPALSQWLKQNVRGHDPIIDDVVGQLRRNISLAKPGRCLGTFLLVGPTGTGKTFLSQLISDGLFPGVKPVILRMNQFKSPEDVFTLIGAPPGRNGFELGGALTRAMAESPFRVIVLDELEKAHKDVLDCLYDILDTGSCREKSTGELIDFSGCVFFATSNAAIDDLRRARDKVGGKTDPATGDALNREALGRGSQFEKAFVARWERIYFLDTLSEMHVAEVSCLNITKYWQQFGMKVMYASPQLILQTVMKNRDFKEYGVRQLMGYIRLKSDPIVEDARTRGQTEVVLDVNQNGEFIIGRSRANEFSRAKKIA